ncbi:Fumarate reductase/succinate dehydrogenase flavoprotein [Rhodopseudomonas palustris HaA2]|uniref:Fumarate reductase/succinate dehydrogenase flavoprotein n=1 Tax=Rhodopseudomonas palustris (strain HaA2) TaxID=316058 RepID=Q2IVH2_RHOP2|nr:FAD-dependent oxidoreductase [Rhodopseudomonas palustris]ABD07788.1 Fumarate reductase/succinate dehydrogenase flavoprotein [Rhodopseudomonas palustris HaA2]
MRAVVDRTVRTIASPHQLGDIAESGSFDVIVVGAGAAGMSAALFAAMAGLKPLLVERTDRIGGTSAYSAGSAWIPNTHHAALVGADDSIDKAALYLRHSVGKESPESMRLAFLADGPRAVADLEQHSHVQFRARKLHPDYNSDLPGATLKGRVLEAAPFDGRKLGDLFDLVREPIPEFTVLGGMMVNQEDVLNFLAAGRSWKAFRHSAALLARHAIDRRSHRRGTRLMMGNALTARLLLSLRDRAVPMLLNTSVTAIETRDGGPLSVTIVQGGLSRTLTCRGGLISATGGFNRHPRLRTELLRKPVAQYCPGAPGHTGQLHDLLSELGAHYGADDRDSAFWAPVSVRKRADGETAVFPHFIFDRGRPGTITVNQSGRRFVNEALSYHPFTQAMLDADPISPSIPAFLIADETALRKYGLGIVRPGRWGRALFIRDGYLTRAETLAELATKLGISPADLTETVRRFNQFARTGIDQDFGRGSTDYQRITAGDMSHGPNPCLGALETAPFYAVRLFPGDIGAATGFVTDETACMLRQDGSRIEGLYACGNDMHSVMGGNYPGPGITLGPAIVFAHIAIRDIASRVTAGTEPAAAA